MGTDDIPDDDTDDGVPEYGAASDIPPNALAISLCKQPLLGDDMYIRMQAHNVSAVDHLLMGLEQEALQHQLHNDRVPSDILQILSALTQMWMFSTYELLRTWRARIWDLIKWSENGGLALKLKSFEQSDGYRDFGKELRAEQIKKVMEDPGYLEQLRVALDATKIPYTRLEHVRISLAKHVVPNSKGQPALAPGYARLNRWCGSLEYELARGLVSYDVVCRRDVADALRAIDTADKPSKEDLEAFDAFMKGDFDAVSLFEPK